MAQFRKYVTLVNVETDRPVQVGGLFLVKGSPREIQSEPFFISLLKQNPHHVVECDETGKPIGDIPEPMPVEVTPKAVRTARDEADAEDNMRHIRAQEKQRIEDGFVKAEASAVAEDAEAPEALDIRVPSFDGSPVPEAPGAEEPADRVAEEPAAPAEEPAPQPKKRGSRSK